MHFHKNKKQNKIKKHMSDKKNTIIRTKQNKKNKKNTQQPM